MPHTRSHGPAAADGGNSESAGNFPARPADTNQTQQSAASLIEDSQVEMDVPINLRM